MQAQIKYCETCKKVFETVGNKCPYDGDVLTLETYLTNIVFENRYCIVERIGAGGMGVVYKAKDKKTFNRDCVVKITLPIIKSNKTLLKRFEREAKILSTLNNPNIVTIYDYGETDSKTYFIVMEYIDGENLENLLEKKKSLSIEEAVPMIVQIGKALEVAHKNGVVHRDLKPANIMVKSDISQGYSVKVLDFGIAKSLIEEGKPLTEANAVLGTPIYMSPEQLKGEPVDQRSDVYSFALTIYKMLSGHWPFLGNNKQELVLKRITHDPLPISQINKNVKVPTYIEIALLKALAIEPNERTPTVSQLLESIVNVVTVEESDSWQPPPLPRSPVKWKEFDID